MASPAVRVLINDRCLRNVCTGVGRYVSELLAALPAVDPGIEILPFYRTYIARESRGHPPLPRRAGDEVAGRHGPRHGQIPGWHGQAEPYPAELAHGEPGSGALPHGQATARSTGPCACPCHPGGHTGDPPEASPLPLDSSAPAGPARRVPDWLRRVLQGGYETVFEAFGALRGYGLYHEPNHIPGPWNGPVVTTIHDLSVLRHPGWHPGDRVRWYERDFLAALPRSNHFISVSEFTRREMVELLHVEPDRITAIPLAPRAVFHPRPTEAVRGWLAGRGLPPAYLLFVGTLEPRKNVPGLLAAYARLPGEHRRRFPLLVAGAGGWGSQRLEDLIRNYGLAGDVRPLGFVGDEDLGWLYAGARALVWPTFYEGFGLPPLECMATGTPVITSRTASLPEVVGDAGLLIDPQGAEGLADAMRRIIEDEELVRDLAERGLARSRGFTWERCAAEHAGVYRRYGT